MALCRSGRPQTALACKSRRPLEESDEPEFDVLLDPEAAFVPVCTGTGRCEMDPILVAVLVQALPGHALSASLQLGSVQHAEDLPRSRMRGAVHSSPSSPLRWCRGCWRRQQVPVQALGLLHSRAPGQCC